MKIGHIASVVLFLIALSSTNSLAHAGCIVPGCETALTVDYAANLISEWFPGSTVPPAAGVSTGTEDDKVPKQHNAAQSQGTGQGRLEQSPTSAVVAVVAGTSIHEDDLDRYIGHDADALKEKLYALRKQALESMIDSFLLRREAARLKASEDDLVRERLKVPGVPAADVDREWANNYEALRPMGEVMGRYRILLDLQSHARTEAFRAYLTELRQKNEVKVFLEKPEPRLRVRTGAGTLGSASAPSELVVFLDYECPFCRKLHPELRSLLAEEPLRSAIRVTVKQFPLSIHHNAFDAALSAVCAEEQHKFAAMHELLLTTQDLGKESVLAMASKAGLEPNAFQQCLVSERASSEVLRDLEEGNKSGVQGTPALFLDGQPIELPDNPADLGKQLTQSMRKTEQSAAVNKNKEHGK